MPPDRFPRKATGVPRQTVRTIPIRGGTYATPRHGTNTQKSHLPGSATSGGLGASGGMSLLGPIPPTDWGLFSCPGKNGEKDGGKERGKALEETKAGMEGTQGAPGSGCGRSPGGPGETRGVHTGCPARSLPVTVTVGKGWGVRSLTVPPEGQGSRGTGVGDPGDAPAGDLPFPARGSGTGETVGQGGRAGSGTCRVRPPDGYVCTLNQSPSGHLPAPCEEPLPTP